MNERLRRLTYELIDGTISPDGFDELQHALEHDPVFRSEYLSVVELCDSLGELADEQHRPKSVPPTHVEPKRPGSRERRWSTALRNAFRVAVAVGVIAAVGAGAFLIGRAGRPGESVEVVAGDLSEPRIAGHATLRRAVGLDWGPDAVRRFEGDLIPNGRFAFDAGVAEIDFFSGATLIVEGPAELDIESDWVVSVAEGRIRANVPPAARGFVVKAAESEIVDLGTEFAVDVSATGVRVEVVDGEVALRGGEHDGRHLLTGEGLDLKGSTRRAIGPVRTVSELGQQRLAADDRSFIAWKETAADLKRDERLIAYFPIAEGLHGRTVPNAANTANAYDGLIVGPVERTAGRFGAQSTGLEFDRAGSRVRTLINGEFSAFTFACWVRIDSLPHRYNALFMADGYENGEPHWQIRNDGRLMFSVMVDDTQKIEHFSELDQKIVKQAGLHRVYYSEPIWDVSKSGQWFHLAAVYDPARRRVTQFVNGEQVASEEIIDRFFVNELRIGPAEIGNWGQPFRNTPWFSVRNINGTIDELAIYSEPLSLAEIEKLFREGKPVGY